KWIIGVGLDSKELGNPPEKFANVFKRARNEGFLAVAHAGEEGPAEYVWSSIKLLKVSRIDHGYHIFEDSDLVRYVSVNQIPVTMCPLASVSVNYFKRVGDMPLKKALDNGIIFSINSDDPSYFGGYINENYIAVRKTFNMSKTELIKLARFSIISSFMNDHMKQKLLEEIDMW
ncbi:MAG: adenosine deaminase, partial [Nitrososphaerota archaeon]|nr:adenosine deaminase [Nitrososphaerota archaeon]MDG6943807.1 adenosine deaminase [Nitrososphaerota archaeon]